MRLQAAAQNPLEWFALKAGLVPLPLAYSHFGFVMSKVILEAVDKGIFETIGHKKISLQQLAEECRLNEQALKSVMGVLASLGLLKQHNELYSLTKQAKKWLLKESPHSTYWLMMFDNRVCFKWMDHVGSFLETGKGLQYHDSFTEDEWHYYQNAMEAASASVSKEAVKKIPVPQGASKMLDIGGSHGLYCLEFCNKYPGLKAEIIDLPAAVEKAKPILAKKNTVHDIRYIPANALEHDFGENEYDLIIMASLAHHFTPEENQFVAQKAFKALKPGGIFSILEILRPSQIKLNSDLLSSIGNFFFALSSTSGAWSLPEIKSWQARTGFQHVKVSKFLSIPGYAAVTAQKP